MSVITQDEFNRQEAMALALEEARNLLFSDLKAATPRGYRGNAGDEDGARRARFAEQILVDLWQVEAGGNPAIGKTGERCAELLESIRSARADIGKLVADWEHATRRKPA
jgi:hypothetical protein